MKWRFHHKARKAFLTMAICLALSQSVFAMPTGGKVVDGTVTGIVNGTVASGGTINVNSNALIDWTKFDIGKNETLNFTFNQDYLNVINHVTGSEMSQLLGALNAKNGNVYLINPNGILVGGGARIDTGSLILSTLNATDDQLKSALKDGLTNLDLTSNAGSKGITIENGANIKVGPFLGLLGNKVQIADNVTISDTPYDGSDTTVVVAAANEARLGRSDYNVADIASVTTGKDNTVEIGAAKFNINNEYTDTYILGNSINMKGTNLNINLRDKENSSTSLDIIAADGYKVANDDAVKLAMNPANRLDLDDVKASADYMHVIGGQTSIHQSDLTLTKTTDVGTEGDPYMKIAALNGKDAVLDDSEDVPQNTANTAEANLTIKDSKLTSNGNIALFGGSVELTNTNLKTLEDTNAKNNDIDIGAFKSGLTTDTFNTVKVTGGSIVSGGDINIQGASVALDGVKDVKSADDIFLMASKQFTFTDNDDEGCLANNTDANALSVKNTTMRANDAMTLVGGKVDVTDGSNLTADAMALIGGKVDVTDGSNLTAGDLEIVAGSSYKNEGNTIAGTDTTNLTISDSTLHANEDATLVGSNINLANTKLEVGTSTDHTYGSNGVVRIAAAKNVTLTDDNTNGFVIGSVNQTGNLTMDKVNLSAYGTVMAYGKTVKLQDSVLSTTNDEDLAINAVNTYKRVNGTSDSWTATPDNTMEVSGSTLTDQGIIELSGGKVTVEKSSLTATGHDGFVDVNARASYTDADHGPYVNKAVAGMDVNVKDTKLSGDDGVGVFGHTVTVDGDSSLTSKAGKVFLAAGKTVEMTDDSLKGDGDPVNIGKNVKYDASKTLFAPDKKLIETTKPSDPGTKPSDPGTKPSDPGTKPSDPGTKPSDPGTKPSDPGTKPSDPGTKPSDPGTKPSKPGTKPSDPGTKPSKPSVVTPDPQPAADIAKNIAQGQADMTKALQENPQQAAAAVKQQAEKLSRSTMTETEKVAQLKGYVEAIQATQESAETKNDLLVAVVKNFEPTQQAGLDAQSKQDEAAQNQIAKAAAAAEPVEMQQSRFSEDIVSPVTVDAVATEG